MLGDAAWPLMRFAERASNGKYNLASFLKGEVGSEDPRGASCEEGYEIKQATQDLIKAFIDIHAYPRKNGIDDTHVLVVN